MKCGDLITCMFDEVHKPTYGLIIDIASTTNLGCMHETEPPLLRVLWANGELENVYSDDLSLVAEAISVLGGES
tara:strand:+ start:1964 stop:2185 length:222 start_codon:yes stop_codon:yes gene_type:complete